MADSEIAMGSENWTKINPYNWDLREILRYKEKQCFSYDGKRIIWSDTLEMLKFFTRCFVSQPGNWSVRGKYKRFCSSGTDLNYLVELWCWKFVI